MTTPSFWQGKRVLVTGGAGFIGSAVVDYLVRECQVPRDNVVVPRSAQDDLRQFDHARRVCDGVQVVIHLAAVTGGIEYSRTRPATQYRESTLMDLNVVEAARVSGVQRLVAIGNMFAYGAQAAMPMNEDALFDGLPGASHRGAGWMKRNLALLADLYQREYGFGMVVVLSANAYGPRDSVDPSYGHVIPATIMKCLRDPELLVWGDGSATRDFLYVDDVARGLVLAVEGLEAGTTVNIGSGRELSIRDLVGHIVRATDFAGPVRFDASRAGGDPRRVADIGLARALLDFSPQVSMDEGLAHTVAWFRTRLGIAAPAVKGGVS
jgi:GDP-L-fucose synthase